MNACERNIDTAVWIDYLRGVPNRETDYLDRELGLQRFEKEWAWGLDAEAQWSLGVYG